MNKTISIPEYFMVKHYKTLHILETLDETDQMLYVISSVTNTPYDEILTWSLPSVVEVHKAISTLMTNTSQVFYPIIEFKNKMWGFRSMSKMTLGEYVDLDTLLKDPERNINDILSLLYRPITKNNIQSASFIVKSTIKALKYEVENVFDYYDIEDYDPVVRKTQAQEFDEFPLDVALGAMAFFLGTNLALSNDTLMSFHKTHMEQKQQKMNKVKFRLLSTTVGFLHSMNLQKVPSYQSQVTKESQT